jgi:pimeloyl-ACP methyl ester carboxylesterase
MNQFRTFAIYATLLLSCADALAAPLPRKATSTAEPLPGIETQFGELKTPEGYRLRTITTRPEGASAKLPAVYFVHWLSCDTVELGKTVDGWGQMMRAVVRDAGMVVMRTDKAGVGDCAALDYETELKHHRLGLATLLAHPWVDPERVIVYGASMGANMAPLIAAGQKVKAVAVWGGGAQSWFERQLGFERRALELGGKSGAEIDVRMRTLSRLYAAFLLDGLTPAEITRRDAKLGAAWKMATGTDATSQFGRPLAFHQQAQKREWAKAWAALDVPVLALFGEYDWYETPAAVELIGRVVNARKPGAATVRIIPGIDHHFMRYASAEDAFADRNAKPDAAPATNILIPWLKEHAK